MSDVKFTSFTTMDFLSDVDMDKWIEFIEATAPKWATEMKTRGLIRWSLNRVWNKGEVNRIILVFEYENQKAYENNQEYLAATFGNNPTNRQLTEHCKISGTRCITVLEV